MTSAQTHICSADGSTHTESNKLYRKVKHRYRPNLSPRQRPRPNRAMIRQRSRRRQRRGEPHTEDGLGVLAASMKRDRRKSLLVALVVSGSDLPLRGVTFLLGVSIDPIRHCSGAPMALFRGLGQGLRCVGLTLRCGFRVVRECCVYIYIYIYIHIHILTHIYTCVYS